MKRHAENSMLQWFNGAKRKPLVLRGARQVGKSTLVRQFAAAQGLVLNEINLERHLNLRKSFASLDISRILQELDVIVGRKVDSPNSLLFLDEIQEVPEALSALRYFYEDRPDLPVVSAGSLLEFALTEKRITMPVGRVSYLYLGPMSFAEFLEETAPDLVQYAQSAALANPIPDIAHDRLNRCVRLFMFVGGMPEAISAFSAEGLSAVNEVQRMLLESYEDDFSKYARSVDLALMQEIFRNLPPMACRKVKYVNFSREVSSREVKNVLNLFRKAMLCNAVQASKCEGVPLFTETEEGVWKALFLDVGLMNRACGIDWMMLEKMDQTRFVNEGVMAEQFVGQHLLYRRNGLERPQLAYWLREGGKNNAEVDFVVSEGTDIFPVEVKAGSSGSLKSLRELILAKHYGCAVRYDSNPPSMQKVSLVAGDNCREYELVSLPLYAVTFADATFSHLHSISLG